MSEAESEIIRLLTEIRDAQLEEMAYRRQKLDESAKVSAQSIKLQERAIRIQRTAISFVIALVVLAGVFLAFMPPRGK